MKSRRLTLAFAALTLISSGVALAQADKDVRADQAAMGRVALPRPAPGYGRPTHPNVPVHPVRPPGYGRPGYVRGPGAGPDHNFYRGGHLPRTYWNHQYVVDDWRGHHLRRPPRGYYWVQTGGDYVLVAIATGIIADILLNQ